VETDICDATRTEKGGYKVVSCLQPAAFRVFGVYGPDTPMSVCQHCVRRWRRVVKSQPTIYRIEKIEN